MIFVQLADIHVRVHFAVLEHLAVPLLIGPSFRDWFFKLKFPRATMNRTHKVSRSRN